MSAEKKPSHGGYRAGSGRRKIVSDPVKKLVTIERDMEKRILSLGYEVAAFLREAGEEKLERLEKKNG